MSDYIASIGLSTDDFEKAANVVIAIEKKMASEAEKTSKAQTESAKKWKAALDGLTKTLAAFGIGLGVAAVVGFGKSILSLGKEIEDSARSVDMADEQYQRLLAGLSNTVGIDTAKEAIAKFSSLLIDAKDKHIPDAIAKLDLLGISFDDINKLSLDAMIEKIADGFQNAADKAAFLTKVGIVLADDTLARKLGPAMEKGGAEIKRLGDNADIASNQLLGMAREGEIAMENLERSAKTHALVAIGWLAKVGKAMVNAGPELFGGEQAKPLPGVGQFSNPLAAKDLPATTPDELNKAHDEVVARRNARRALIPTPPPGTPAAKIFNQPAAPGTAKVNDAGIVAPGIIAPKEAESQKANGAANIAPKEATGGGNALEMELELLKAEKERTIQYDAQLGILDAQEKHVKAMLTLPNQTKLQTGELDKQLTDIRLQRQEIELQRRLTLDQNERDIKATELRVEGNTHLANLEKARAQYATQIADAEARGDKVLANQLKTKQALAEFDEQLRRYQLGPQGRREEDAQDRKNRRDARTVAARENLRNTPVKDGLTSGGLTSGGLGIGNDGGTDELDVLDIPQRLRKPLGDRSGERHSFSRQGDSAKSKIPSITAGVLNVTTANIQNKQ